MTLGTFLMYKFVCKLEILHYIYILYGTWILRIPGFNEYFTVFHLIRYN